LTSAAEYCVEDSQNSKWVSGRSGPLGRGRRAIRGVFRRFSAPLVASRTGATNPICNHRRTGSSFHVLGSRSDFASFGAEHSSGPREVGHHPATRLHAWVTLSPRGAAVLTYRASGRAENSYFLPAAVPLLAALLAALLARCSLGQYRCALRYNTNKGWTWKAPVGMRLSGDLRRDREF
jgi:hypothetical protein